MTLSLSHGALLRNVTHSRDRTKKMNKVVQDQLFMRLGGFYGENSGGTLIEQEAAPRENYYHRWCSYVVPQMTSGTPVTDIETTRAEEQAADALYLELVCNRWTEDVKLGNFMASGPAVDMQHGYGAMYVVPEMMVGEKPIIGVGSDEPPTLEDGSDNPNFWALEPEVPWQPKPKRLPQGRYFCDMVAMTADEVRFEGHTYSIDRNDIRAEDGWDLEITNHLTHDDLEEFEMLGRVENRAGPDVKRNELVFHEVWVKHAKPTPEELEEWGVEASPGPEQGFNGWTFTLSAKDEAALEEFRTRYAGDDEALEEMVEPRRWPRKPRPFYGPEWGPYQIYGAHEATNSPLPIGPLLANEGEIKAANVDSNIVLQMMRNYKRLILLNARTDKDDVQVVKDGEHDGIYRVRGLDRDGVISAEIGGMTDQVMAHLEHSKDLVEETLGLDRLHSGSSASSANTATRDAIADSAASIRFTGVELGYLRGLTKTLRTVAWYFHEDNRMVRDLGTGAAKQLGMEGYDEQTDSEWTPQPRYFGGRRGSERSFRSLHVNVQAHSIRRVTERMKQEKASLAMNVVLQVVPLSAQFPDFPWGEFMEWMGDQMDLPALGKLFRQATVDTMTDTAMQMGTLGAQSGGQGVPMPSPGRLGLAGNQSGSIARGMAG